MGHIVENYVATELLKLIQNADIQAQLYFYRTRDGREVDFVLETPQGKLVGIEVKMAEKISEQDLAGLKELEEVAGKDYLGGIILCHTPRVLPYGKKVLLVPFSALWH